ncbi:MAG: hypothetical protein ABSF77_02205 [Spirochaetia bacterium]|jgi:hypothetical protein
MRAFIVSCLFILAGIAAAAEPADRLFIRPWIELEPLVRIDAGPYPIPVDVAEKSLLELGRVLVSGMIYGWMFTYIPSDAARRVRESFILTPVAQIAWGSTRMRVTETEVADERLWARIMYTMDQEEALRRAAWDSNTAALSTGQGTAAVQQGPAGRTASLEAAVKDAIRLSLDARYVNKPRQITGEIVLWDDPITVVRSGAYTTTAKVKLLVQELVPYRIF